MRNEIGFWVICISSQARECRRADERYVRGVQLSTYSEYAESKSISEMGFVADLFHGARLTYEIRSRYREWLHNYLRRYKYISL